MSANKKKRQSLTHERIINAATELADIHGVDALTIRKLSSTLNVKPMTIYHYVENRDAIIDGMVDAVFAEIDLPPRDTTWKDGIRQRSVSARCVLSNHPWAVPLMDSRRNPGPATLRHHDAVLGCFRSGGLSVEETAHAYALIDAYIYGFAIQEAAIPATSGVEMEELAELILGALPEDQYPHLREFTTEHVLQPNYNFSDEFDFGLELILDGIDKTTEH